MVLLYIIFKKIHFFFYKRYIKSNLNFSSSLGKRTLSISDNIKINNPNVIIGNNVKIYGGVIFWGDGKIIIEDNVRIGFNTIIYSHKAGGIIIGENTAIAAGSYIIDTNHHTGLLNQNDDSPISNGNDYHKRIIIGKNVWVAAHCVIAAGSILNDGCIIGANSFVNKEVPENAIAVGSPVKVIKYRG